jgi:hypothetical protein
MNFRRVLKLHMCGISVFLFVVAAPYHSALGWTFVSKVTLYDGPGLCVQGESGIDHLRPDAFSGNLAYAGTYALSQGCGAGLTLPDGWAAVRLDVYRWTGSDWALCRGTNWRYGGTGIDPHFGYPVGPGEVFDYGGFSSCGQGYYGTLAFAFVWDGSAWRGGGLWSGYEFVPVFVPVGGRVATLRRQHLPVRIGIRSPKNDSLHLNVRPNEGSKWSTI